jgi:hypothetical protein
MKTKLTKEHIQFLKNYGNVITDLVGNEITTIPFAFHKGKKEDTYEVYKIISEEEITQRDKPMQVSFTTTDQTEIKRIAKADDMANFIWELVHNGWREFKETNYDYEKAWGKINELLDENNIVIDDLWG